MAIHMAKMKKNPSIKEKGLFNATPMAVITSEDAHYSISKGANFLGFGTEHVVKVKTDDRGSVIPEDLENKIQECKQKVSMRQNFKIPLTGMAFLRGFYFDILWAGEQNRGKTSAAINIQIWY